MKQTLQLVAFNIPYPPDYGGVIDIYYKIKALHECEINIYLHCLEYDRPQAVELEKYCKKVFYYKRNNGLAFQLNLKPYIVITRANKQLLNNLSSNSAPIIFEGIHTCNYLNHPLLFGHKRLVRTHNIEHEYYNNLFKSERGFFKRMFFKIESFKLRKYESILSEATHILSISPNDFAYFNTKFGHSHHIPAFHPLNEIKSKPGKGDYILFHGNLSVAENIQAVEYLLSNVIGKINFPVIIAGKNPSDQLIQKIRLSPNIQLFPNPDNKLMETLIENAHICLIPTFQDTGIKLKLLASLFSGRFCIANSMMINNTGLEHLCHRADTPNEIIEAVNKLFQIDFTSEEIEKRKLVLNNSYSNYQNALKIIKLLD